MPEFIDDLNRKVSLPEYPKRVISLVPSVTETIIDLGWVNLLYGRTTFCIHPADKVIGIPKVGGVKQLLSDKVIEISPDLIIAVKEENDKNQVLELGQRFPVYVFDIKTIEAGLKIIKRISELLGNSKKGSEMANEIRKNLPARGIFSGSVLYLIWKQPYMAAGKNTFIDSVLETAGFKNVLNQNGYPALHEPKKLHPDFVFASSEPYNFTKNEVKTLKMLFKDAQVLEVDGEIFSWYGTYMRFMPGYFKKLTLKLKAGNS